MNIFEDIATMLRVIERLPRIAERLELLGDSLLELSRRPKPPTPQYSVLLIGSRLVSSDDPIDRTIERPALVPFCAAWTGPRDNDRAVPRYTAARTMYTVQGRITSHFTIGAGALLVSVNGALFNSVRVGDMEQYHNYPALGPACLLSIPVAVGYDVGFTLELPGV